ncbi:hypothetical protein C2G38_2253865 [Gigaspora rosea]|uniref:Uncharacterized protein n=1 Tax=Gigaspora rosea TaxID=44941 RepID=A0A397UDY1_9GLOM|nr:hypothetical protein C2G38_2253865 [Gigaspora rosea]
MSQIYESDPLVLNELDELDVLYFQKAQNTLKVAEETKCRPQLDITESYFQKVVSMSPPNSDALTALGYIYHVKEVLGICPYDPITHDLLSSCLHYDGSLKYD